MSLRCRRLWLTIIVAALAIRCPPPSCGAERDRQLPRVRRIYVPADAPAHWPRGDWQPIPLAEFDELYRSAQAAEAESLAAGIDLADYSAVLVGEGLAAGRLVWNLRPALQLPATIALDPLDLPVSNLLWASNGRAEPAIWGADAAGRMRLLVDRPSFVVNGEWSLRGRRPARSLEFDLRLAPAAVSRVTIEAPDSQVLSTSVGDVLGPRPGTQAGWSSWTVAIGGERACRLRFEPRPGSGLVRPLLVTNRKSSFTVRPEVIRLQAEFEPDVLESPVRQFTLHVDHGVQLTQIEYGDGGELSWNRRDTDEGQQIVVQLPHALFGPGQRLAIRGLANVPQAGEWKLPQIRLLGAVESVGQSIIRLQRPFQLADLRLEGCRLIDSAATPDGELLTLRDTRPHSAATLVPEDIRPEYACQNVALVDATGLEWTLRGHLEFRPQQGRVYGAACRVPAGWRVVNVRSADEDQPGRLASWDLRPSAGGTHLLELQFSGALDKADVGRITFEARGPGPLPGEPAALPMLTSPDAREIELLTLIATDEKSRAILEESVACQSLNAAELPERVRAIDFVRELPDTSFRRLLAVAGNSRDSSGTFTLRQVRRGRAAASPQAGERPATHGPIVGGHPVVLNLQAAMRLATAGGFDYYQVRVAFSDPKVLRRLDWYLNTRCELLKVRLDGRTRQRSRQAEVWTLILDDAAADPLTNGDRLHELELEYRVETPGPGKDQMRKLYFPEFPMRLLGYELTISAPAGMQIRASESLNLRRSAGIADTPGQPVSPVSRQLPFNPLQAAAWQGLWNTILRSAHDGPLDSRTAVWSACGAVLPLNALVEIAPSPGGAADSWCLLWLTCLLTVVGREFARARVSRAGWIVVTALATALFANDHWLSNLAAYALAGIGLGLMIPAKWLTLRRGPERGGAPAGLSGGLDSGAPAMAAWLPVSLIILAASGHATLADQNPFLREYLIDAAATTILVPVDAAGGPAERDPLCYVDNALLTRLRQEQSRHAFPQYLIRQARYTARLEAPKSLAVTARFEVAALNGASPVRVVLPFEGAVPLAAQACLVDGLPADLVQNGAADSLLIELPPSDGRPSKSRSARMHSVTLQTRALIAEPDPGVYQATLRIPPVGDSLTTFDSDAGRTAREIESISETPANLVPQPLTSGAHQRRPGRDGAIRFRWSNDAHELEKPAEALDADVRLLADVGLEGIRIYCRATYRPLAGRPQAACWRVHDGWHLQSLQGAFLAGHVVEAAENGCRRYWLEFQGPLAGPAIVDAQFVCTAGGSSNERVLPLPDFADPTSAGPSVSLRKTVAAFRSPADFRLRVSAAPPTVALAAANTEEFLQDWPAHWPRPMQAFELTLAHNLQLTLDELSDSLQARSEAHARFQRDRLDWTYVVEIERPELPPHVLRFDVDPRLRIRSVSVDEDGADRLRRWSQVDERLTVFLVDRATRAIAVRIDAAMHLTSGASISLPRITLKKAPGAPSSLTLAHDPELTLEVLDRQVGQPPSDLESSPQTGVRRLELAAAAEPVRVRTETPPSMPEASLTMILPGSPGAGTWNIVGRYRVPTGRLARFDVSLPSELADNASFDTSVPVEIVEQARGDERVRLSFLPATVVPDVFQFSASAPRLFDYGTPFVLPEVSLPDAAVVTRRLLAPAGKITVAAAHAAISGATTTSPEGAPAATNQERWQAFEVPNDAEAVTVTWLAAVGQLIPCTLADLRLEVTADGACHGRMLLWLPPLSPPQVDFDWPFGTGLAAAFVDGVSLPVDEPDAGMCRIKWPATMSPRTLFIAWSAVPEPLPSTFGLLKRPIPWPRGMLVSDVLLASQTPPAFARTGVSRPTLRSDLETALIRWNAALYAGNRSGDSQGVLRNDLEQFMQFEARHAESLAQQADRSTSMAFREQLGFLAERSDLAGEVDLARQSSVLANLLQSFASTPLESGGDVESTHWRAVQTAPGQPPALAGSRLVWRRRALHGAFAICAAVIIWFCAGPVQRLLNWLDDRPELSCALFGLVWWLFLPPSVLGFCVMVVAGVAVWNRHRRSRGLGSTTP
ncbi:MAG: hypothetical protein ACT4QC_06245 [Planctomycetaceae bacterium]